ncbi:hypothetical protein PENNAL_c0624G02395, partial [Penicillium nalgiovense]
IHRGPASQTVPPIKDTSFGLAGQGVYAKTPPPQQPTELIYCAASMCIPKRKREYRRRRTDIRPQCTSARTATLCRSSSLGLATRTFNIDIAPEGPEDTAPPRIGDKKTKYDACSIASSASTSPPSHHVVFAVRIASSYPITTVQFLATDGFVAHLWGSEVAQCTQRGFEATAGECDKLDTTSCQMA